MGLLLLALLLLLLDMFLPQTLPRPEMDSQGYFVPGLIVIAVFSPLLIAAFVVIWREVRS